MRVNITREKAYKVPHNLNLLVGLTLIIKIKLLYPRHKNLSHVGMGVRSVRFAKFSSIFQFGENVNQFELK